MVEKSKLPVLYWHRIDGYVCCDYTDEPKPPPGDFVEYMPVKRCATCLRFERGAPFDRSPCTLLPTAKHDGTSFCSEHIGQRERG